MRNPDDLFEVVTETGESCDSPEEPQHRILSDLDALSAGEVFTEAPDDEAL